MPNGLAMRRCSFRGRSWCGKFKNSEDQKFSTQEEIKKLIARYNSILEENSTLAKVISANGLSTDPRDYEGKNAPPPAVRGLVLETRRGKRAGTEFVEISLGSDDGLLERTRSARLPLGRRRKVLGTD